jgi:glutamate N-acetyltransferase/amino-acid N-acetyltransferase
MLYFKEMEIQPEFVPSGGITSPGGFLAGAVSAGIKYGQPGRLDLGILLAEDDCRTAAVFTTNRVKAAPVLLNQRRLKNGRARAVVMNSGYANSCTGEPGLSDAVAMTELAAKHLGLAPEAVLVASTGVIGVRLPLERIGANIPKVKLSREGGHDLARAIMTTDTVPKEVAVRGEGFTIGGMAKGSGMIHPDLATLLAFLTTDANVELDFLRKALRKAVDISFNMVSVDGDNSTNDMVLVMAGGKAGGKEITAGGRRAAAFQAALNMACIRLAREIARDGEGATKLIEVTVTGAGSLADARSIARTVVSSALVKAAVYGSDPNWGRVVAAAGRSGAALDTERLELHIGGVCLVRDGCPHPFDKAAVVKLLNGPEVAITLNLNTGGAAATAWGCDLSPEYVTINSDYTT